MLGLAFAGALAAYLPKPPVKGLQDYRFSKRAIELHRQAIWGFAIHHAVKAPLFGHGPDTPFLPASS